jgi:hypothetical protein
MSGLGPSREELKRIRDARDQYFCRMRFKRKREHTERRKLATEQLKQAITDAIVGAADNELSGHSIVIQACATKYPGFNGAQVGEYMQSCGVSGSVRTPLDPITADDMTPKTCPGCNESSRCGEVRFEIP